MNDSLQAACRLAEELRESDAAEYSRDEIAIMALYYELRRLRQKHSGDNDFAKIEGMTDSMSNMLGIINKERARCIAAETDLAAARTDLAAEISARNGWWDACKKSEGDLERMTHDRDGVKEMNEKLRADLAAAREELEGHAWKISPGMAQAQRRRQPLYATPPLCDATHRVLARVIRLLLVRRRAAAAARGRAAAAAAGAG